MQGLAHRQAGSSLKDVNACYVYDVSMMMHSLPKFKPEIRRRELVGHFESSHSARILPILYPHELRGIFGLKITLVRGLSNIHQRAPAA
jgi:hypothetical protein